MHYDRIDVSKGITANKTTKSKKCDVCNYWYFFKKECKFQSYVCNRCHDLLMMSMNLSNIYILNIKGTDYCCVIGGISKSEAKNCMKYIDFNTEKS